MKVANRQVMLVTSSTQVLLSGNAASVWRLLDLRGAESCPRDKSELFLVCYLGVLLPALFVDVDTTAGAFDNVGTGFFFADGAVHIYLLRTKSL